MVADIPDQADSAVADWVVKVLPEHNTDYLLLDDDGDALEVSTGALELSDDGAAEYSGPSASWKHVEATCAVSLAQGTFDIVLRYQATDEVKASFTVGADAGGGVHPISVTLSVGLTSDTIGPFNVEIDPVYRVGLRVVGKTATLILDDLGAMTVTGSDSPGQGTLRYAFDDGGAATTVSLYDVRVHRLRHDGSLLDEVVVEDWADGSAWTLTDPGADVVSSTHNILDLSAVSEVLLAIEYTARYNFIASKSALGQAS